MERNADKIKRLEQELGRYRKKVDDQARVEARLRVELNNAYGGMDEMGPLLDAILIRTAVQYGETVRDEEDGDILGFRLTIPQFSAEETLKRYKISARRDEEAGNYILGVMERETGG